MLSSLYAQKESYTLKELVELTDQPEVRLAAVDCCLGVVFIGRKREAALTRHLNVCCRLG